jgi:hypothetical protein
MHQHLLQGVPATHMLGNMKNIQRYFVHMRRLELQAKALVSRDGVDVSVREACLGGKGVGGL